MTEELVKKRVKKCARCGSGMDPWGCVKCGHTNAEITNPAWDAIQEVPHDDLFGTRVRGAGKFTPTQSGFMVDGKHVEFSRITRTHAGNYVGYRHRITGRYTWAIPAPESLAFVVKALGGRPVVELGAGSGYWAWMLTQLGVDVVAYDAAPVGHLDSWYHKSEEFPDWEPVSFHQVLQGRPETLADHPDRVLFLCWPNYGTSFAYDAVKAYPGDTVVYIGEVQGCNADDDFWALMEGHEAVFGRDDESKPYPEQEWERVAEGPMLHWSGLHDELLIYKRKDAR